MDEDYLVIDTPTSNSPSPAPPVLSLMVDNIAPSLKPLLTYNGQKSTKNSTAPELGKEAALIFSENSWLTELGPITPSTVTTDLKEVSSSIAVGRKATKLNDLPSLLGKKADNLTISCDGHQMMKRDLKTKKLKLHIKQVDQTLATSELVLETRDLEKRRFDTEAWDKTLLQREKKLQKAQQDFLEEKSLSRSIERQQARELKKKESNLRLKLDILKTEQAELSVKAKKIGDVEKRSLFLNKWYEELKLREQRLEKREDAVKKRENELSNLERINMAAGKELNEIRANLEARKAATTVPQQDTRKLRSQQLLSSELKTVVAAAVASAMQTKKNVPGPSHEVSPVSSRAITPDNQVVKRTRKESQGSQEASPKQQKTTHSAEFTRTHSHHDRSEGCGTCPREFGKPPYPVWRLRKPCGCFEPWRSFPADGSKASRRAYCPGVPRPGVPRPGFFRPRGWGPCMRGFSPRPGFHRGMNFRGRSAFQIGPCSPPPDPR